MSRGLLLWGSITAGLQVLAGAGALTGVLGEKWAGLAVVVVGALQVATATYTHGLQTPTPAAGAYQPEHEIEKGSSE